MAAQAAPKPSRAGSVKTLLMSKGHHMTVREICLDLGYPDSDAKFVSSILVNLSKLGRISINKGSVCGVTHRKVTAYVWSPGGQAAPQAPKSGPSAPPPAKPPKGLGWGGKTQTYFTKATATSGRAKAPKAAPPPKTSAKDQAKIDAARKAAEAAKKARQTFFQSEQAKDQIKRAHLTFEKLTGCRSKDFDSIKTAYRRTALRLHPDRGGNDKDMASLSAAYQAIKDGKGV